MARRTAVQTEAEALVSGVERWIPVSIARWADGYEVSDHGRVRSLDRAIYSERWHGNRRLKGKLLKLTLKKCGYYQITLGIADQQYVHRLVALAFVANPDNLPEVNHKDFDCTNNHWTNLEWVTHAGNVQHAMDHNEQGQFVRRR